MIQPATNHAAMRRTRLVMGVVLVCMIAAFSGLYVYMKQLGQTRADEHKSSFYEYILQHHVGQLTDIDDGTGFDPNSYILTLDHRLPNSQIQEYALRLMKLYVQDDRGVSLTIMSQTSPTAIAKPMADVVYNDQSNLVTVSATYTNGSIHTTKQHVAW